MEQRFASFKSMPSIPYKIYEKLLTDESEDAENLWKLLKYPIARPFDEPNLTFEEKKAITWTPEDPNSSIENLFNLFLKPLVPSALNDDASQTQLRISRYKTTSQNQYQSSMLYKFEIIVNEKSCMIYNQDNQLVEKTDIIESLLTELLSGYDVGTGINFLRFDRLPSATSQSTQDINNSKSLYGRTLLLSLLFMDTSKGGDCE